MLKFVQMSVFLLKKYPFVLAFCLFMTACNTETPVLSSAPSFNPEIPEAEMIKILTDVHIAEGLIQMSDGRIKDSIANVNYQRIYKHYNINEEKFDANLEQYLNDPVIADKVYKKVLENLSKLESKPDPTKKNLKKPIERINN